jgi:hypothetical protein
MIVAAGRSGTTASTESTNASVELWWSTRVRKVRKSLQDSRPSSVASFQPWNARRTRSAMANGRCRLRGGLSTGARTIDGIENIRRRGNKAWHYSASAQAQPTCPSSCSRRHDESPEWWLIDIFGKLLP